MSERKTRTVEGSYKHDLSIPHSWEFSELKEVIEIVGGSQPPKSDFLSEPVEDSVRLIQIRDYKSDKNIVYIPKEKAKRFVTKDEVMIGRYGPPIFQILRGLEGAYNVALMKAKPKGGVFTNDYLYWYLSNQNLYHYVESASDRTAGQSGVNKKHLELYPVGIPPLAEQKRIVEKLNEVLAQVDTIKARLDGIPDLLKRFRQSVLASAVSGKLTEQWRGEHTGLSNPLSEILAFKDKLIKSGQLKVSKQNLSLDFDKPMTTLPTNWEWSRFISLCTLITDGKHGNCNDEDNSGYYFLSAKDVKDGELIYNNARQINKLEFDEVHQRTNLEVGDICLVNTGATVGKLAIVTNKELASRTTFQKSVAVLKVIKPYVNNKFISYFLLDANKRLLDSSTGSAVNNLLLSTIKQMCVPVPPVEEQKEIVRLVDQYFAFADTIEAQVKKAQARVDNLTQSILAKAFRGELVTQDPNDEPADKLLEHIAEARKEAEALAKAAKKAEAARKKAAKAKA